jgi:hypothetical protein
MGCLPYIYKFSDLRHRVNLFHNFFESFFCYDLSARGIPFPLLRWPRESASSLGAFLFLLHLSLVVCSLLVSRKEKMMWRRFKASFRNGAHMRDYLLAVAASVLLALCVGALLFAWVAL